MVKPLTVILDQPLPALQGLGLSVVVLRVLHRLVALLDGVVVLPGKKLMTKCLWRESLTL